MSFLNQINPNGVTVQELGTFLANNPTLDTDTTSNEAAAVNGAITTFLGNPSVMGALSTLVGQTSNGIMTPTMISMLLTLVGNPIYNYGVPIAFFEAPRPEELVTATQGTTRYGNTHFTKEHPPLEHANASNLHDNETFLPIELSEHKLTELLQRLAPNGLVPLRTLQQYQPQDFEEMKLINALKNKPIFEALAKLDGQGDSLSADDIHIAASKDHIFLMDQHLALVFKP
jgi:hypothetical protein